MVKRAASIVLLAAVASSGHAQAPAEGDVTGPLASRAVMTAEQVIRILDETVDWYRLLGVQQQSATQPSDLLILYANRQADEAICQTDRDALLAGDAGVGHAGRMTDEGLYATEAFGKGKVVGVFHHLGGGFQGVFLKVEADHPAEVPHLAFGYFVAGVILEAWVIDVGYEIVIL